MTEYEDGVFTPKLTCGGKEVILSNATGHFTRIGKRVFFNASLMVSKLNGATGYVRLHTELPYKAIIPSACTIWAANTKIGANLVLNTCLNGIADSGGFIYTLDPSTGSNEGLKHTTLNEETPTTSPSHFIISGSYPI